MPELPEVETIRKGLAKRIIGKKISRIEIGNAKSFQGRTNDVLGTSVINVLRRAKLIQIKLSNKLNLLFHLKLTGQLIYRSMVNNEQSTGFAGGHPSHDWHAKLPNTNTRVTFILTDNSKLFFNDLRKFGWCKVLTDAQIAAIYQKDYGLEPLDEKFDLQYLLLHAKRIPNRRLKQFLMDQKIAAGMGNIYTDESLFEARIMPVRKVKDIKILEWQKLIDSIKTVLNRGIKYGGTTDSDYLNAEGERGGMQNHLNVYHQTGKPCPNKCGGVIKRIRVNGRGTHFCPKCQK